VQPFEVELVYGYIVKKRRKPIRRSKGNEELVQALVNLGYKTHEAKRVVASCPGEGSVEQRLEAILRSLV
jgi:Holliday junction resolvasome RuvABC DNA-binding subunit